MPDRINKEVFIANILECFTLLQTYEECYKEILDIIDVINGLAESDLTVENLQKLIKGSEYISLDLSEDGANLVISLDRTHVDETVKEDSPNLVTSGAVFDAIANANGNVLRLPINVPTEPLVVMVGTNNAQTNVPLGDGLAIVNNHLVATGGGGTSDVTKAYVDEQDAKLQQAINATNTEVSKKLDKMTSAGSGVKAYVNQNGVDRLLTATSDKTRELIVRWDNLAQLHANAGTTDDAVVNKKQLDDAIAGVSGGDVTKAYVDEQDNKIKASLATTDSNVAKKVDKITVAEGSVQAYVQSGSTTQGYPVSTTATANSIVRRTSTGTLSAVKGTNASDVVTYQQIFADDVTIDGDWSINSIWSFNGEVKMINSLSLSDTTKCQFGADDVKLFDIYFTGQVADSYEIFNLHYGGYNEKFVIKLANNDHVAYLMRGQGVGEVYTMSQNAYNALSTKDKNTLYIITD